MGIVAAVAGGEQRAGLLPDGDERRCCVVGEEAGRVGGVVPTRPASEDFPVTPDQKPWGSLAVRPELRSCRTRNISP